ncbi:MAG: hypothetical protein ABEI53_03020 [Candidatus Magasanikbacteria bacterium]
MKDEKQKVDIKKGEKVEWNELEWENPEKEKIVKDILNLRDDQVIALSFLVGVKFDKNEVQEVIKEIKKNGKQSQNLEAILSEGESKEKIKWWVSYFKNQN